jgi:hypothetical protein
MELPEELKTMRKLRFAKWSENDLFFHTTINVTSKLNVEEPKPKVAPPTYKRQRSGSNILAPRASLSTDIPREALEEQIPQYIPMRTVLILELLESERKYLRYLNIFYELYLQPLMKDLVNVCREHEFSITDHDLDTIIPATIQAIVTFERTLYVELKGRVATELEMPNHFTNENVIVSDLFLLRTQHILQLYVDYPLLYERATEYLNELRHQNPEFDRYLKSRRKLPLCDGLSLESFLILPVTRVTRLVNLIQNLSNNTPEEHEDYKGLAKASKQLRECLTHLEKNIFLINNKHRIIDISKKLKMTDLYRQGRVFIR